MNYHPNLNRSPVSCQILGTVSVVVIVWLDSYIVFVEVCSALLSVIYFLIHLLEGNPLYL